MPPLALAAVLLAAPPAGAAPAAPPVRIVGGRAFDHGSGTFVARDLAIAGGTFIDPADVPADARTIDAAGFYLLPPYAEAHTHGFYGGDYGRQYERRMLEAGVFYALSANNQNDQSRDHRDWTPDRGPAAKLDAAFANGGWTRPGGHPVPLYRGLHTGVYRRPAETFMAERGDDAFYEVAVAADLDAKWPTFMATEPDLVKLYLLNSQSPATPAGTGDGLSPQMADRVVAKAEAAGLRTIAHVESVQDIAAALDAGVDALAHLPYSTRKSEPFAAFEAATAIPPALAARLAEANVAAIGTQFLAFTYLDRIEDEAERGRREAVFVNNLRTLREAGVTLLIGSDASSPFGEADDWAERGVIPPADLLTIWTRDTPRWIFPDRKLGELAPGFEGNVIGVTGNPLDDWSAAGDVALAVKAGLVLAAPGDAAE